MTGLPNFFGVGAEKAGTTFLYSVLRDHSKIKPVEKDDNTLNYFVSEKITLKEYKHKTEKVTDFGIYLSFAADVLGHKDGADKISEIAGTDVRILISLRDPVERMVSEWKMRVAARSNDQFWPELKMGKPCFAEHLDFLSAVEATTERLDKNLPAQHLFINESLYNYIGRSLYADSISAYINRFGRENVHIIVMEEDFGARTPFTLMLLFRFLGLLDEEAIRIAIGDNEMYHHASAQPKSFTVDYDGVRLTIRDNKGTKLSFENPDTEIVKSAHDLNNKMNFTLTPQQKKDLFDRYFKDDVSALESLLNRDFSHWRP